MTEYRLFIAIELPKTTKEALAKVQDHLKGARAVRWTRPEQIHLTLQFLGNVPIEKMEAIIDALQATVPHLVPFELTLTGVGAFPNLKRPRVIWAGVSNSISPLQDLHRAVIVATKTVGFKPEERPFKPHLTFGRVQKWAGRNDYAQIQQVIQDTQVGYIATFSVDHIGLIRSQLKPEGPIYTTLATINLEGG
jgi:2'-5' RNA ligase